MQYNIFTLHNSPVGVPVGVRMLNTLVTSPGSSRIKIGMDAIEHLYKVLVIGEYGVGKSFCDPLEFH